MNTIMNTTRLHKWIIVLVLALGLAVTSTASAHNAVYTPMVEDLDANDFDIFDVDDLDVGGDVTIDGDLDVVTGEVTVTGPNGVGDGGDAPDVLTATAGDGAEGDNTFGGKGGGIELTSGTGGAAVGDCSAGDAGDIKLTSGKGGHGEWGEDAGDGGDIIITSGDGGDGDDAPPGDGGDIELTTGATGTGSPAGAYGNVILVKNGGKVGIATTSPTRKLDVNGSANVSGTIEMGTLVIPTKSTTGDPASPVEGQMYTNTFDNKVRVYSDGAWRDLATW